MKIRFKKIWACACFQVIVCLAAAQDVNYIFTDTLRNFPGSCGVRNERLADVNGADLPGAGNIRVKKSWCALTLEVNPFAAIPAISGFSVKIYGKVAYRLRGGTYTEMPLTLTIDHNPGEGSTYKNKDVQLLPDVVWAKFTVETVKSNFPGNPMGDYFRVHAAIFAEQYYTIPSPAPAPANLRVSATRNGGNLLIEWDKTTPDWAAAYDLEWTFTDWYSENFNMNYSGFDVACKFRQNATRVRVTNNRYEIPLVFELGALVFRVRGVGIGGMNADQWIPGEWSWKDDEPIHFVYAQYFGQPYFPHVWLNLKPHESNTKNWQHITTFAEEGKRKDVVTYYDGSMRARQSATRLNSAEDAKILLVGETIYDHQGRPGIQMLPAPFKPAEPTGGILTNVVFPSFDVPDIPWGATAPAGSDTLTRQRWQNESPALRYQPRFNVNPAGQAYSRADFDLDRRPAEITSAGEIVAAFKHEATTANTQGYFTILDHPELNGRPELLLQLTPDYTLVYNPFSTGIRYDEGIGRWTIVNLTTQPMPVGIRFNVLVERASSTAFIHRAKATNVNGPLTYLDHPLLNDNLKAVFFATQVNNPEVENEVGEIGVTYDKSRGRWAIYKVNNSENLNTGMLFGATFHISIQNGTGFGHLTNAANIWNSTASELSLTNGKELIFLTHRIDNSPRNEHPKGVFFPTERLSWSIVNADEAPMPVKARFNVLRVEPTRPAACLPASAAAPVGTQSGTGNYYSPANPAKDERFNAYLPNANGYPFLETEYTPDNTDRISRQGGVGAQHQLGSGHETRISYDNPSQEELDRMFGSDAGNYLRYKKEMVEDENEQVHLTYRNSRGAVVATALAGKSPDNLDSLPYAPNPMHREWSGKDNVRDDNDGVLLQWHNVVIIQNRTPVSFDYRLDPRSFETNICGTQLCYDCQYDLEWEISRDCGEVLHRVRRRLGTMSSILTCQADNGFTDRFEALLDKGTYRIRKRLVVNREAIAAYTENLLSHVECLQQPEAPPVICIEAPAQCVPCQFDIQNYTLHNKSVDVLVRQSNQASNCSRACSPQISDVSAFEVMLADLRPGGQYAEFQDPVTRAARPGDFPLSIFNAANHLRTYNGYAPTDVVYSWQNPVYDYRDPDGSIAWVEVTDLPAASGLYNTDVVRTDEATGRRFVLPKHILDLQLIASVWKDSWSEALLPLHPEYAYWEWKQRHGDSYAFDTLMRGITKFDVAIAQNLFNPAETPEVPSRDPFFSDFEAARVAMRAELINFLPATPNRSAKNIYQAVALSHFCNVPGQAGLTDVDLSDCIENHRFSVLEDDAQRNRAWETYRDFYLSRKEKIVDQFRKAAFETSSDHLYGRRTNDCIGRLQCPPCTLPHGADRDTFSRKARRYPVAFCMADGNLPVDTDDDLEADAWDAAAQYVTDIATLRSIRQCGVCPVVQDLVSLLGILAHEGKLSGRATNVPVTARLVADFSNPQSLRYDWDAAVSGNKMFVRILDANGSRQATITLKKEASDVPWENLAFFACPQSIKSKSLTLTGFEQNTDRKTAISVQVTKISFTGCAAPNVLVPTPHANTYVDVFRFLFQDARYGRPTDVSIYPFYNWTPGSVSGSQISGAFERFNGRCEVRMTLPAGGVLFSEIADISNLRLSPQHPQDSCSFVLKATTGTGQSVDILVESRCLCAAFEQYVPVGKNPWRCCLQPSPRAIRDITCADQAATLAEGNRAAARAARIAVLRDSFAWVLTQHCLGAVERIVADYNEAVYQHTLYYYDMAGNLVQTVPPAGVQLLTPAEVDTVAAQRATPSLFPLVLPAHRMATTYRFNTLNEVVYKNTPDGGAGRFCYDELGRALLSQDAVQAQSGKASFIVYDQQGRVAENGLTALPGGGLSQTKMTYNRYRSDIVFNTSLAKTEVFRSCYDAPCGNAAIQNTFEGGQQHLRKRIATVTYSENGSTVYDHATHYSYDLLGNVKELVQENAKLQRDYGDSDVGAQAVKNVRYRYDLLTGSVTRMTYQPGKTDQFIHWYFYDADQRIRRAYTSQSEYLVPGGGADLEAKYHYYWHGPLARLELGADKVQGIDYAYTLQGSLKGINSVSEDIAADMGKDGRNGFAPDAHGFALGYFEGDYQPISVSTAGANRAFLPVLAGSAVETGSPDLFNGNVQFTLSRITNLVQPLSAVGYRYDQLNRLKSSTFLQQGSGGVWTTLPVPGLALPAYSTAYEYDPNGNITRLRRTGASTMFDNLSYFYPQNAAGQLINNRLRHLADAGVRLPDATDLPNQTLDNYGYDARGRLTNDRSEGDLQLVWTDADKLKSQRRDGRTTLFEYDALGRRALKKTDDKNLTLYVRDAKGNVLAEYEVRNAQVFWKNAPIYAGNRIGMFQPDQPLTAGMNRDDSRLATVRGLKRYELTSHTGDVLAVVSDHRVPTGVADSPRKADVRSAQDYYPFGMPMPGRSFTAAGEGGYRYGFQGMEKEDGMKGAGNAYTTEFRQYDARVGRWLSVDPMQKKYQGLSPYVFAFNNPITTIDPLGNDPPEVANINIRLQNYQGRTIKNFTSGEPLNGGGTRTTSAYVSGEVTVHYMQRNGSGALEMHTEQLEIGTDIHFSSDGRLEMNFSPHGGFERIYRIDVNARIHRSTVTYPGSGIRGLIQSLFPQMSSNTRTVTGSIGAQENSEFRIEPSSEVNLVFSEGTDRQTTSSATLRVDGRLGASSAPTGVSAGVQTGSTTTPTPYPSGTFSNNRVISNQPLPTRPVADDRE